MNVDNTEFDVCLCCGQKCGPGQRLDAAKLERAYRILMAMGYTARELLAKHRAQIDYQLPGLADMLIKTHAQG